MKIDQLTLAQRNKTSVHKNLWEFWQRCVHAAPALLICGALGTSYFMLKGHFLWGLTILCVAAGLMAVVANVLGLLERDGESVLMVVCVVFSYPIFKLFSPSYEELPARAEILYCVAGGAMGFGAGALIFNRAIVRAMLRNEAISNGSPQ